MSVDLAKNVIDSIAGFLAEKGHRSCKIIWHGGEPLLWGIDNYECVFLYMKDFYPNISWDNNLQTNLTLLSDDSLCILRKYGVKLSTSMDGYEELHDMTRVTASGGGSFNIVMDKLSILRKNKIKIGVLVVLNSQNIDRLLDIYEFYKKNNQNFIVNPLYLEGEAKHNSNLSITPEQYSDAIIGLFDYWINDDTAIDIPIFTEWVSSLITNKASVCTYSENCQNVFTTIEPSGDISACDRLCGNDDYIFGNIMTTSLSAAYEKKREIFANRTNILENTECKDCKYWKICHGGCPADSIMNKGSINEKFTYCEALKRIYSHIENYINTNGLINQL